MKHFYSGKYFHYKKEPKKEKFKVKNTIMVTIYPKNKLLLKNCFSKRVKCFGSFRSSVMPIHTYTVWFGLNQFGAELLSW